MSKSKGTFITADQFADVCEPELLRYYFATKLNSKIEDLDLNLEDLAQKINSDLVGKFSNIFSRSAPFISKNNNRLSKSVNEEYLSACMKDMDQILDQAITLWPKITEFIKQKEDKIENFSASLSQLMQIFGN